jgi:formate hydrogenlyase subunit 6/NADH:ubiquinone oxidoreductase subunit I
MEPNHINIVIRDKSFSVPQGMNAIQAFWYCGIELTHGIGCLGGVCGACTMTYKIDNGPVKTALACQTMIAEGMNFNLYQPEFKRSVHYKTKLNPLNVNQEINLKAHFNETLSSTRRCVTCGACSMVCPQEIDAMKGVKEAINGNFKTVSDLFLNCVMCGLCASVCEVNVMPHLVGLYSRKVNALFLIPKNLQLQARIEEIKSGRYDSEWNSVLNMNETDWVQVR